MGDSGNMLRRLAGKTGADLQNPRQAKKMRKMKDTLTGSWSGRKEPFLERHKYI